MAGDEEILGLGQKFREDFVRGAFRADDLTPKGALLLDIGRGRELGSLSPQDRTLIGLDPTLMQRVGETVSGAVPTGAYGVPTVITEKYPRIVTEGLPRAGRAAWQSVMQPTVGGGMLRRGEREPVFGGPAIEGSTLDRLAATTDPGAWGLAIGEKLMQMVSGLSAGVAELGPEKAKPLTRALAENLLFLGRSMTVPFATNVRGRTVYPQGSSAPLAPPAAPLASPVPREMLALPPAPPDPIVPPHARTRSMLPAAPEMRALPPSSAPGGALPPAVEPLGKTGEAGALVLGDVPRRPPPAALPDLPRREVRPSSTQSPTVITADDLPPTTTLLDQQGRPITQPVPPPTELTREQLRQMSRTPLDAPPSTPRAANELPPVPEGPLPSAVEAAGARRGLPPPDPPPDPPPAVAPASATPPGPLPPVPDQPLPGGTSTPVKKPVPAGRQPLSVSRESVDTRDPDQVRRLILDEGGLSASDYEGIPGWARRRAGRALDEIAADVAKAQGRKAQYVEAEIAKSLQTYGKRRTETKALRAQNRGEPDYGDTPETWGSPEPPEDIARLFAKGEWASLPVEDRRGYTMFLREMERGARLEGPDFLLRGFVPPIPLPGPEEDEEGLSAAAKRAAQIAGLSLPVAGMLFARFRGGARRPKQQGLGLDAPGPQKGLFGAGLPEVPPLPTTGMGGAKLAPAKFGGMQERVRGEPFELWTLTDDIPGHPKGSTLSRATLEGKGFTVPPAEGAPRVEKTLLGDQTVIPGTPPREIPKGPLAADLPQKDITDTPLFGQEKAARTAASDAAQGRLDLPPIPEGSSASTRQRPVSLPESPPPPPGVAGQGGLDLPPVPDVAPAEFTRASEVSRLLADLPMGGTVQVGDEVWRRAPGIQGRPKVWRQAGSGKLLRDEEFMRHVVESEMDVRPTSPLTSQRGSMIPGARIGGEEPPPSLRPPRVLPQYQTERVGPATEGKPQPTERIVNDVSRTVEDIRAKARGEVGDVPPVSSEFGGAGAGAAGGGHEPPHLTYAPADTPGDPAPQWSRFHRFLASVKTTRPLRNMNVPEEVVGNDPVAYRMVRQAYRANDNQLMLRRELEDAFEQTFKGLPEAEVQQIGRALDTAIPGRVQYGPEAMAQEAEALRRMLPGDLAERAIQARDLIVRYTDATGLPQANRFASYFPHFRDRVRVNETTLILDPEGQPYLAQSYEVPKRMEAFFHRARTNADPPSHLGRDAFRIFARATARHLTLNGGGHPFTGERMVGFLNEIAPDLPRVMPELRPYTADFLNHFLGTPGSRPGSEVGHQTSRILRNLQGARLLSGPGSMIVNATQQGYTLALVRPSSWVRGYADMLDPQRRALAQRWIGFEELGKADLERVQQVVTALDTVEDVTAQIAHVTMTGFRKVETGNRYHAFLAGMRDAEALGIEGRAAIEYARDIVEQSQFPTMAPAKPEIARSDWGAALWQMKQFQTRSPLFIKNLIRDDIRDFARAKKGEPVPIEAGGKVLLKPDGTPYTRDPSLLKNLPMHRTAKFIVAMTAIGGPDVWWPGLDEYLREQEIKVPGILPALGVGIASLSTYGFISPGDFTRTFLFFAPGPALGNIQDALSAATGKNYGRGLNEFLAMTDLSYDQHAGAMVRSVPGLGVFAEKAVRSLRSARTPGEERASRSYPEAFGLEPSTGPLTRRANPDQLDPVRLAAGLQPAEKARAREERHDLGELDARAKKAVGLAADDYAAGDIARGDARLRDAEQRLKLPVGSLQVSTQGEKSAEQRRSFTPLERRQFEMRNRFPDVVEKSRRRIPGEEPDESSSRRGLGVPRLRLR